MAEDQLHPASIIFRDYLLSEAEDENRGLRKDISALEAVATIELRFDTGRVATADLRRTLATRSFDRDDDSSGLVRIPIDSDPHPLSEFRAGKVYMLRQDIADFPGMAHFVVGIRSNAILVRFTLSKYFAIEGVVQGLSASDYESLSYDGSNALNLYLTAGVGFQNPSAIMFTPTMAFIDISPGLRDAIIPENGLETSESQLLRRDVLTALGHTDAQLNLLRETRLLKSDFYCLQQIRDVIGCVEVVHPGFWGRLRSSINRFGATLEDGMWKVYTSVTARSGSITFHNISRLEMFLSGVQLKRETVLVPPGVLGEDVLSSFIVTFDNGVSISRQPFANDLRYTKTMARGMEKVHFMISVPVESFPSNIGVRRTS